MQTEKPQTYRARRPDRFTAAGFRLLLLWHLLHGKVRIREVFGRRLMLLCFGVVAISRTLAGISCCLWRCRWLAGDCVVCCVPLQCFARRRSCGFFDWCWSGSTGFNRLLLLVFLLALLIAAVGRNGFCRSGDVIMFSAFSIFCAFFAFVFCAFFAFGDFVLTDGTCSLRIAVVFRCTARVSDAMPSQCKSG